MGKHSLKLKRSRALNFVRANWSANQFDRVLQSNTTATFFGNHFAVFGRANGLGIRWFAGTCRQAVKLCFEVVFTIASFRLTE